MPLIAVWRESLRLSPDSIPNDERSISSSNFLDSETLDKRSFIFSASSREKRRPIARSLVTFEAPTGMTDEKTGAPSLKMVSEVTLPPISIRATPSSFSVSVGLIWQRPNRNRLAGLF